MHRTAESCRARWQSLKNYTIRAHHQEQRNRAGRLSEFLDRYLCPRFLDPATAQGLTVYNVTSNAKKTAFASLA